MSDLIKRNDVVFLITAQRSALLEAAAREGVKLHHSEVLTDMAVWWNDLAEAVKKLAVREPDAQTHKLLALVREIADGREVEMHDARALLSEIGESS